MRVALLIEQTTRGRGRTVQLSVQCDVSVPRPRRARVGSAAHHFLYKRCRCTFSVCVAVHIKNHSHSPCPDARSRAGPVFPPPLLWGRRKHRPSARARVGTTIHLYLSRPLITNRGAEDLLLTIMWHGQWFQPFQRTKMHSRLYLDNFTANIDN